MSKGIHAWHTHTHARTLTCACAKETAEEREEQTHNNRNCINSSLKFNEVSERVYLFKTFTVCWSYSDTVSLTLQSNSTTVLTDSLSEHVTRYRDVLQDGECGTGLAPHWLE